MTVSPASFSTPTFAIRLACASSPFRVLQLRQTKQDPNFKTTGNDRCTETYREAGDFADQLKEIRRTIRALRAATEGVSFVASCVFRSQIHGRSTYP